MDHTHPVCVHPHISNDLALYALSLQGSLLVYLGSCLYSSVQYIIKAAPIILTACHLYMTHDEACIAKRNEIINTW